MAELEPTPALRRFPRVQLVFCLICLLLAALTWMKFSYVWEVTPVDLDSPPAPIGQWYVAHRYFGSFVRLRGTAAGWCIKKCGKDGTGGAFHWLACVPGRIGGCRVRLAADVPMAEGDEIDVVGRVIRVHDGPSTYDNRTMLPLCVDPTASRSHPISVVGIVVGAMGCLIFGLGLRRWYSGDVNQWR